MYMCSCVYFSGLPAVRKPMEDASFLQCFNYKATFPFSATELPRASVTEKRADKGLECPSHPRSCTEPSSVLLRVSIPGSRAQVCNDNLV